MAYAIAGLLALPVVGLASTYMFLLALGSWMREVEKAEQDDEES